jgi:RNA polymerase sigma-70 factor, ECF subfamily
MSDASTAASEQDLALVEALRAGDETAFMMLIERYQPSMLRIARMYVSTRAVAEDVVQDAWLGVLKGLDGFEGRSSLRTWIFRILVNIAKTRGQREARSVPFSSVWVPDPEGEPTVDLDRFLPADHLSSPGHWAAAPASWETVPEDRLLSK